MGTKQDSEGLTLSERTPVRLALVFSLISGIVVIVWWASGVSADLRTLVVGQAAGLVNDSSHSSAISELKERVRILEIGGTQVLTDMRTKITEFEKVGSPVLVPRVSDLEKRMTVVETRK